MAKGFGKTANKTRTKGVRQIVAELELFSYHQDLNLSDEVLYWSARLMKLSEKHNVRNGDMPFSMKEDCIVISVCSDRLNLLKGISVFLAENCTEFEDIEFFVKIHDREEVTPGENNSFLAMETFSTDDEDFWMLVHPSGYTLPSEEIFDYVCDISDIEQNVRDMNYEDEDYFEEVYWEFHNSFERNFS